MRQGKGEEEGISIRNRLMNKQIVLYFYTGILNKWNEMFVQQHGQILPSEINHTEKRLPIWIPFI